MLFSFFKHHHKATIFLPLMFLFGLTILIGGCPILTVKKTIANMQAVDFSAY
jgi:hypothetical protein